MDDAESRQRPIVYVIAGPNGAGKTTFATEFLPGFVQCREFLNADLIAAGLSPFAPETQNIRAGRLLLERIEELAGRQATFGFETTLSGRTYVKLLGQLRTDGYRVVMFFLWLPSAAYAVERVATRVREGGHNIPEGTIRRRYGLGLPNLFGLYRNHLDELWLYDGCQLPPQLVFREIGGKLTVACGRRYQQIQAILEERHEEGK